MPVTNGSSLTLTSACAMPADIVSAPKMRAIPIFEIFIKRSSTNVFGSLETALKFADF